MALRNDCKSIMLQRGRRDAKDLVFLDILTAIYIIVTPAED